MYVDRFKIRFKRKQIRWDGKSMDVGVDEQREFLIGRKYVEVFENIGAKMKY